LSKADKGKVDKAMTDRAAALFQKGRTLPDAGKFRAACASWVSPAAISDWSVHASYWPTTKRNWTSFPEAAQAEVLLLAANSERQLGHPKEAETLYHQITTKYPDREEGKDAAYQQLINVYTSDPSALSAVGRPIPCNEPYKRACRSSQTVESRSTL
jgi:hypothetical protein